MAIKTRREKYKSYSSREATIHGVCSGVPHGEPGLLVVRVTNHKTPRATLRVYRGWFSEMRGTSSTSHHEHKLTGSQGVALACGFIDNENALAPLVDYCLENGIGSADLARFWTLAQQENAHAFVRQERRSQRYADCQFKVGDWVISPRYHRTEPTQVVGVHFDEVDLSWRVSIPGLGASQHNFTKVEAPAVAAV
jgi:hypothetical protein